MNERVVIGHNSPNGGQFIFGICKCLTNNFKVEKKVNFVSGYSIDECSHTVMPNTAISMLNDVRTNNLPSCLHKQGAMGVERIRKGRRKGVQEVREIRCVEKLHAGEFVREQGLY